MVSINYVDSDGNITTLDLPEGHSLMQGAVLNGIDGIIGECGGSMVCATCHCYVDPDRFAELEPASAEELDLLDEVAAERKPNSRFACQIKVIASYEGLTVFIPDTQE